LIETISCQYPRKIALSSGYLLMLQMFLGELPQVVAPVGAECGQ
jgi:hypothetical protein